MHDIWHVSEGQKVSSISMVTQLAWLIRCPTSSFYSLSVHIHDRSAAIRWFCGFHCEQWAGFCHSTQMAVITPQGGHIKSLCPHGCCDVAMWLDHKILEALRTLEMLLECTSYTSAIITIMQNYLPTCWVGDSTSEEARAGICWEWVAPWVNTLGTV